MVVALDEVLRATMPEPRTGSTNMIALRQCRLTGGDAHNKLRPGFRHRRSRVLRDRPCAIAV